MGVRRLWGPGTLTPASQALSLSAQSIRQGEGISRRFSEQLPWGAHGDHNGRIECSRGDKTRGLETQRRDYLMF